MKAPVSVLLVFPLLLTAGLAAAGGPTFPKPEDLAKMISTRLQERVPDKSQRLQVAVVVTTVIQKHLKGANPEEYKNAIAWMDSNEGRHALVQEMAAGLHIAGGATDVDVDQVLLQAKSPSPIPATADVGPVETADGTPGKQPLAPMVALTNALGVFFDVQRQIGREIAAANPPVVEPPTSSPGNGVTVKPAVPPIDPRIINTTIVNQNQADQKPGDQGAQGVATRLSYLTGDYEGGSRYGRNYYKDGGGDPNTLVAAGRSSLAVGDNDFAQQAGQRAAESDPSNKFAEALANLSKDHMGGVNVDGALSKTGAGALTADKIKANGDMLMQASAMPEGGAGAVSAGGGRAGGRNPQTAAEIAAAAQKAATTPPSKVQQSASLTREAASALNVRDYQAAYNISSQAIDLNPRNAQAWNYRAIADNKLAQYTNAVYDASFSLGLVPGNAPALQTRSWAFAKQGQYREALADANFTIEKEPMNAFAFQNRAYAQAGMGDRAGALASLRKSAELDPRFKDKYESALQAPENSDLLFLFNDEPAGKTAGAAAPTKSGRGLRLFILSILGGLIVALGVLNIVSERFREKMRQTVRRVIGSPSPVADGGAQGGAFWGGQYEMLRTLGSGGMGIVYEAVDKSLDRKVAVKKMRDEIRLDPGERQRFVQEARVVASVHHPNIVDIFAIVEDDQDVYLVFEYVHGRTLSDALKEKGAFDLPQARRVLAGACAAVEHAHKNKIIHRDIKPSNIMLSEDGAVKVMDFGVARQAKDAMTRQALTNTIVGTPPYMAPEQEQGTVRKESDVFGLGAVFYEMLTGRLPFQGQGAGMLLNKINGKHVAASSVVPSLPQGLDAVISKALAADPEKRYQTPAEFLAAVDAFLGNPS